MANIFVTGGSRGIGLATVKDLCKRGHDVWATYHSTEPDFTHGKLTWLEINLADIHSFEETVYPIFREEAIDVLINNAGIFKNSPFTKEEDADWLADWKETMDINLYAPVLLSRAILEHWKNMNVKGRLINVTSRAAYRAESEEFPAYGASKAALNNFTKTVARSYSKHGITAVNVAPGFVETQMADEAIELNGIETLAAQTATGTIAQPEDIAEIIADLAEAKTRHITGSTIHVNSGSYLT